MAEAARRRRQERWERLLESWGCTQEQYDEWKEEQLAAAAIHLAAAAKADAIERAKPAMWDLILSASEKHERSERTVARIRLAIEARHGEQQIPPPLTKWLANATAYVASLDPAKLLFDAPSRMMEPGEHGGSVPKN